MIQKNIELVENIHDKIAPHLLENEFTKRIMLLQMFTNPTTEPLHIFLVGNAATGKSELCLDICKMLPNSSYAASGISRVGLLEKLVYSNNGYIFIDEFSKQKSDVRSALRESMEHRQVSIDKHGIHTQLPAAANIIAMSNPRGDRLMEGINILSQLPDDLPLISRFHLIVPFYGVSSDKYGEIAIKSKYKKDSSERTKEVFKYVFETKRNIPIVDISDSINEEIGNFIGNLQKTTTKGMMVTPRLITGAQSMIAASARLNLRTNANEKDLERVENILTQLYE